MGPVKRFVGVVAVLAMVGALSIACADPARAATPPACPNTIPSAGFSDVSAHPQPVVDAIDCLAFYRVAMGVSDDRYDPAGDVARWQLALFLARQLEVHGVQLPAHAGSRFADLGGVPPEAALAIAQLTQLGVVSGTTGTTFAPFAAVTRWQMALFVKRTLIAAGVSVPIVTDGPFTDVSGLPPLTVQAINQLAAIGIVQGVDADSYGPNLVVSRWQMPLFLTRVLAADGITSGIVGVVYAVDKNADTFGVGTIDGTTVTSGRSFQTDVSRWRVNGEYTTKAAFEAALTVGDHAASGAKGFEMWLNDRPMAGVPATRSDSALLTVAVAPGVVTGPINYTAKDLSSQLGVKTGVGGSVKFRIGGSGASAFNRFNWESTVDAIIAGSRTGTVSVGQEGPDIVWTVTDD